MFCCSSSSGCSGDFQRLLRLNMLYGRLGCSVVGSDVPEIWFLPSNTLQVPAGVHAAEAKTAAAAAATISNQQTKQACLFVNCKCILKKLSQEGELWVLKPRGVDKRGSQGISIDALEGAPWGP